jgi:hypothetical protein
MPMNDIVDYAQVRATRNGRAHLLLGNGFSISCDPVFHYASLYDRAVAGGLSTRAQRVFERLGTNNFEGAMRLLSDADWVARVYGLLNGPASQILDDLRVIKHSLVDAIARSHLEHTGRVAEARKAAARQFFADYHNIFTTNYDLLVYWVIMSEPRRPRYLDGFGDDPDEPASPFVVFNFHIGDNPGLYYLHGALHLFLTDGQLAKHCWIRSQQPLTDLIRAGLDEERYPIFVAEGRPEHKLEQIHSNSYLSYAFDKLTRIQGRLVVFGSALSPIDSHLRSAIARTRRLQELFISIRDPGNTASIDAAVEAIERERHRLAFRPLVIRGYLADTAHVWG